MTKIIALTGGSGFVGRRLVPRLTDAGAQLRLLARDPDRLGRIGGNADVVHADLADEDALSRLVKGADCVIHLAGAIAAPDRQTFDRINVTGTANIARIAAHHGVTRFVHLSSMAARQPELSAYGASKQAGEAALAQLAGGMSWVILRPPAVYGPGDRATLPLITQLTRRHAFLPGSAHNRTSLIHVDDLADALIALTAGNAPQGTIHELHDGKQDGYSWGNLAEIAGHAQGIKINVRYLPKRVMMAIAHGADMFTRITGKPAILNPGKVRELYHADWVARHNLLAGHTDWQPHFDFASGVTDTLEWYRRHQWLPAGNGPRTQNKTDQSETTV